MVEITVSNDNFNALMDAHVKERVLIKHKNLQGEIYLEKLYDKLPKKQNEVIAIEELNPMDFADDLRKYMKNGYIISSTSCSDGCWRAILVKGSEAE